MWGQNPHPSKISLGGAPSGCLPGPPAPVKGAQFQVLTSGRPALPETLEVIETDGTWVHAKIVDSQVWYPGGDVWVNLATTLFGYVKVIGIPKLQQ